jgi:stage V sporulation protein K
MSARIPAKTADEIQQLIYRQLGDIALGRIQKAGFLERLVKDPAIGGRIAPYTGPDKVKAFIVSRGATGQPVRKSLFRLPRPPDPMEELNGLIGLDAVKAQVKKTVNLINLAKVRNKAGLPSLNITHHIVFTGNSGTGKTTVARLVGRIYKNLGLLKSGHLVEVDRGNLIASYIGQTAPLVKQVVAQAMDGVLFIDEAYSLASAQSTQNDFGAEAIQTLIKLMEDNRDRLVVIVAGYTEEMKTFIASNPGLASRFKTFIEFPDYDGGDLFKILNYMCETSGCRMSLGAMIEAAALMNALQTGKGFGNARTVRNIFEECLARQAGRLAARGKIKVDVRVLEVQDIPKAEELANITGKVV